nr:HAD hydrolase family protein [Paenibacillus ginsengihumi]
MKGKPAEFHGIDACGLAGLLRDAAEAGLNVLQFRGDSIEVFRRTAAIDQFEHKEEIACRVVALEEDVWAQGTLEKVILLGDVRTSLGVWERWCSRLGRAVAAVQSESDYLELVSIRAGKGAALRKVAGMLGVKWHETMAIGNQIERSVDAAGGRNWRCRSQQCGIVEAGDRLHMPRLLRGRRG